MIFMISVCCGNALFQDCESCAANAGGGMEWSGPRTSRSSFVGMGNMGWMSSVQDPPISTLDRLVSW